jgi:hypothetical protein
MSRRWRFRLLVCVPNSEPGLAVRNDLDNDEAAEGDCGVRKNDREDGCASAVVLVKAGWRGKCSTNAPGTLRSNSMVKARLAGEIGHATRST